MTSASKSRLSTCPLCAGQVYWIRTPDGRSVCLDSAAPIYCRTWDPDEQRHTWHRINPDTKGEPVAFVVHSAVCVAQRRQAS